jgi:hypothetical protein
MVGEIGGSGLLGSREYDLTAGSDPRAAVCWLHSSATPVASKT